MNINILTKLCTTLIIVTLYSGNTYAGDTTDVSKKGSDSNWDIAISLGYGERSNPILNADDVKLAIDINIAWYGQRWFFDNGDLGYTLSDTKNSTLNTVARINSDRIFFQKTNTQYISIGGTALDEQIIVNAPPPGLEDSFAEFEIPKRDYALELGLEYITDGAWGVLHVDLYQDVVGVHNGAQVSLSYSYPHQYQRWYIEPSVGFNWKSKKLNDYYWGLSAEESQALLTPYTAASGTNLQARVLCSYQINKKWAWVSALDYEKLSSAITDSPITDKDTVFAWYTGFSYRF